MKVNLGGDRIGSGSKMNVDLKGYERSTHNLNTDIATTMAIGTLLPIHHSVILAGDTREIDIDALLLTHPTEGPLFGSFKLQVDVFKADMRLYIAKLHMNLLETGLQMSDIKIPQITIQANNINWAKNPNNQQINPSSIFKYLHISGVGYNPTGAEYVERKFNAIPWLMYWDIVKNYYANKQERKGAVIHSKPINKNIETVNGTINGESTTIEENTGNANFTISRSASMIFYYPVGNDKPNWNEIKLNFTNGETRTVSEVFTQQAIVASPALLVSNSKREYSAWKVANWGYIEESGIRPPSIVTFPLSNLDDIKMDILAAVKSTSAFEINATTQAPFGIALTAYHVQNRTIWSKLSSQEGLALKTYQSDLFNNWLNTEYIDGANGVNARTAIQTDEDGKFTIDNFLIKQKMYDHLNRISLAGGTVDDMMQVTYDVKNKTRSEIPTFEGGLSKELTFEQVISNSSTSDQPLGTIAGRGVTRGHNGGKIRITNDDTQHGYYMVIASLTPRLKYTQGNSWHTNLKTYDDLFKPAFNQIGFQNLITDQMASWDTMSQGSGGLQFKSAGKQPAWINYQTEIDRAFGNFAEQDAEGWMILDRNYDWDEETKTIKDLTTYIDPEKYNGVFAYRALDAQNIWAQFKIEDKAIRKMSANQIPRVN